MRVWHPKESIIASAKACKDSEKKTKNQANPGSEISSHNFLQVILWQKTCILYIHYILYTSYYVNVTIYIIQKIYTEYQGLITHSFIHCLSNGHLLDSFNCLLCAADFNMESAVGFGVASPLWRLRCRGFVAHINLLNVQQVWGHWLW